MSLNSTMVSSANEIENSKYVARKKSLTYKIKAMFPKRNLVLYVHHVYFFLVQI